VTKRIQASVEFVSQLVPCSQINIMFQKQGSSTGGGKKKAIDTPLRKSDRRKLRDLAADFFRLYETDISEELLDAVFTQDSLVVRKLSHAQLNKVQLFFRGPSSDSNCQWPYLTGTECVWMTVDSGPGEPSVQCPSVAFLSLVVNFPAVVIPSDVSKYLCRGAHLMRAGIISIPLHVQPNRTNVVAIQVKGNPQPFGVGVLRLPVKDETSGIGVHVWMCYGDDIYHSTTAIAESRPSRNNPVGGAPFDNGHYGNLGFLEGVVVRPILERGNDTNQEDSVSSGVSSKEIESHLADVGNGVGDRTEIRNGSLSNEIQLDEINPSEKQVELPLDPDDLFHQAACRAMVNIKDKDLPMLSSCFYGNHVLKHFSGGELIQVKNTSHKKFGTYLLHQHQRGLVTVGEDKNDKNPAGYLKSINRSHLDLRGIKKTKEEEPLRIAKGLKIVSLYVIPQHFISLMRLDKGDVKGANAKSDERRGTGLLTSPEVRDILEKYCTGNNLITTDASEVNLDGPLTDALYKKSHSMPPTLLTRKDLNDAWMNKMEPAYALVQMPGNQVAKMARGAPPMIEMEVSRLGGNKLVTRLRGLEEYGIDGEHFCKEVSKRFACAGTVISDDPKMGALKKGHVEVLFQGQLVDELRALLIGDERLSSHGGVKGSEYKLPKQSIAVTLKKGVSYRKKE
jgi:translation initiation factor 2D